MTFKIYPDETISADSYQELAEIMFHTCRTEYPSLKAYMKATARATQMQFGRHVKVRTRTPDVFIEDLIAAGLIEIQHG